jgi:hypothetical protein
MSVPDLLATFASSVRADRAANPGIAGDGTELELLIAPRFRSLVEPKGTEMKIRLLVLVNTCILPHRPDCHGGALNSAGRRFFIAGFALVLVDCTERMIANSDHTGEGRCLWPI